MGKDTDRGLKEVAEQTGPDNRSSLAEPPPAPKTWVPRRPRKRQAQPLGTAGARAPSRQEGSVPDSL